MAEQKSLKNRIDKKRIESEISQVQAAMQMQELRILEMQENIERLESSIEVSKKTLADNLLKLEKINNEGTNQ